MNGLRVIRFYSFVFGKLHLRNHNHKLLISFENNESFVHFWDKFRHRTKKTCSAFTPNTENVVRSFVFVDNTKRHKNNVFLFQTKRKRARGTKTNTTHKNYQNPLSIVQTNVVFFSFLCWCKGFFSFSTMMARRAVVDKSRTMRRNNC
jgi:hypothetical protein